MGKPKKCITRVRAKELSVEWWKTRGKAIEDVDKIKDICAVNFSIEELEQDLAYVKENSKGVKKPGITIWMASYPEDDQDKRKGYSTVFLSPTKMKAEGTYGEEENDFEENEEIEPYNHGAGLWPPGAY